MMGQERLNEPDVGNLRQDLATCSYCQRVAQGYRALDDALIRQFGASARALLSRADIAQIMGDDYRPITDAQAAADGFSEEPDPVPNKRPRRSGGTTPPAAQPLTPRPLARHLRTRRVLSLFSAVAAVLVIALVAAALYASHRPVRVGHSPTPALSLGYERPPALSCSGRRSVKQHLHVVAH
jgi:hypothetical protein